MATGTGKAWWEGMWVGGGFSTNNNVAPALNISTLMFGEYQEHHVEHTTHRYFVECCMLISMAAKMT